MPDCLGLWAPIPFNDRSTRAWYVTLARLRVVQSESAVGHPARTAPMPQSDIRESGSILRTVVRIVHLCARVEIPLENAPLRVVKLLVWNTAACKILVRSTQNQEQRTGDFLVHPRVNTNQIELQGHIQRTGAGAAALLFSKSRWSNDSIGCRVTAPTARRLRFEMKQQQHLESKAESPPLPHRPCMATTR